MRQDLLGLEIEHALDILRQEGKTPQVKLTCAPKRAQEEGGVLRVVQVVEDGAQLTVARFLDPISDVMR